MAPRHAESGEAELHFYSLFNTKNRCDLLVKELAQMQVPAAHKHASK
jgi:hypothetical protein